LSSSGRSELITYFADEDFQVISVRQLMKINVAQVSKSV
jgi:hypothetical protein